MDKDGYITVTLGMVDKNIPGKVFDDFKKRCLAGQVRSALGAPTQGVGEPSSTYFQRLMTTNDESVCAQILDVELTPNGKRLIGKILPMGIHGPLLDKLLNSWDVTFGMRSFHERQDTRRERPAHIATYDLVLNHESLDNTNSPVEGGGS